MYNVFTFIVPIITGIIVIILLLLLLRKGSGETFDKTRTQQGVFHTSCPLCGSGLEKGQRVKSVLFKGTPDSMMEIYGCPHCYPPNNKIKRICPVCKTELAPGDIVIARVFLKPDKTHVHVLGCSECYRRKY